LWRYPNIFEDLLACYRKYVKNRVLLHHGWTNKRPVGHWLRLTAAELRNRDHRVWYPQFPDPDTPDPETWQAVLLSEAQMMDEVVGGDKIAVCHSLGCLNWMVAALNDGFDQVFDRVLFVAPPDPIMTQEAEGISGEPMNLQNPELAGAIKRYAKSFEILASDQDRWLPRGISIYEQALSQKAVIHPGAGHFSLDDGFGPYRGLIDWIETGDREALLIR